MISAQFWINGLYACGVPWIQEASIWTQDTLALIGYSYQSNCKICQMCPILQGWLFILVAEGPETSSFGLWLSVWQKGTVGRFTLWEDSNFSLLLVVCLSWTGVSLLGGPYFTQCLFKVIPHITKGTEEQFIVVLMDRLHPQWPQQVTTTSNCCNWN